MNVGKAALLILASVGTLHLIEVVTSFQAGGWIYYSPVAREYLGERTFIDVFALLGLGFCGVMGLVQKFRRGRDRFSKITGW